MVELLAPAGDLERFKVAIEYGADAVYLGGKQFSLRARASNFDIKDIKEAVEYAHKRHRKVYVTVNMIPHQEDFEGLENYLITLNNIKVDAIICASRAILDICKRVAPRMEVHISTQQTATNSFAVKYWQDKKADRIVLAREIELTDLINIKKNTTLPIEVFVQGAMCANYSGRCTISNMLTNRDANRGGCAQSCRWNYHLYKKEKVLDKNDYLLSFGSKDMNASDYVEQLLKIGVSSFKIEGRMKTKYYIANVVKGYRLLIDEYQKNGSICSETLSIAKGYIHRAENRATFAGFYPGIFGKEGQLYNNDVTVSQSYVANVIEYKDSIATIEVRNYFKKGDTLSILNPDKEVNFVVEEMIDVDNKKVEVANKPMQVLRIKVPCEVNEFSFIRLFKER